MRFSFMPSLIDLTQFVSLLRCKDLMSQVSSETDPVALLPKVISLLYVQVISQSYSIFHIIFTSLLCTFTLLPTISNPTGCFCFLPQVFNKALQAPGRAISAALSRLKARINSFLFFCDDLTSSNLHRNNK